MEFGGKSVIDGIIFGGIMEVQPSIVTILADTVIHAADLDEAAAVAARESAERILAAKKSNVDFTTALAQISQAAAKLRTIKLAHRSDK